MAGGFSSADRRVTGSCARAPSSRLAEIEERGGKYVLPEVGERWIGGLRRISIRNAATSLTEDEKTIR